MMPTERLARAALELHRLALAAAKVRDLPSPVTPREKNVKGAADPTAGAALDPRRLAVAEALDVVLRDAELLVGVELAAMSATLRDALNAWDGRRDG